MHVQPVHRQVVAVSVRLLGVDERQRHERPAVVGPAGERRQQVEPGLAGDHLGDRPHPLPLEADLEQIGGDIARAPELPDVGREQRLRQIHQPADEFERPLAEGQGSAAPGAEQVGDQREGLAGHVGEEQRRALGGDHPAMDLGHLEMGIDRRGHHGQVAIGLQPIEKRTQVRKHSVWFSLVPGPCYSTGPCQVSSALPP